MNIPVKELLNGFKLPEFGLGTLQMGGKDAPDMSNDAAEITAIKAALEMGVAHIDTAEAYGQGHTEELVGEAIQKVRRSKLFITSKVSKENHTCEGILESCKKSLKRLGTDYLDLYLLHEFSTECPLEEAVEALDKLVDDGLVRHIGVSNFTKEHLADAKKLAQHTIVCNQVYYNLVAREPERPSQSETRAGKAETSSLLEYCQKRDVMLVAYRPVEKGKLLEDVPTLMKELCVKYQKTPAQIAINWLTSQKNIIAIAKTSNMAHLKENLGAVGWHLTQSDVELLRREYPGQVTLPEKHALG